MLRRLLNRLKFELERFVVRSPLHRLAFIAVLIGVVSLVAGYLARWLGAPFATDGDAVWWAFLRLTDPGYLGDDQGAMLRTISTVVTVLGYVLFLGALIAIMTQWLNATMERLESGLTPIAANDHVLVLGYSSRTAAIVRELLVSEARVERFLKARGARKLKIVILADRVDVQVVQDLKDRLGVLWRPRQIVLRTGTPLRIDHLHRVDFLHAAAILLPSHDLEGETSAPDGRTIKALLATSSSSRALNAAQLPLVVAEIADMRRASVAERAYGGPIEVLATDALVARLLVQTIREPGVSSVYEELLAPAGTNEIYVRVVPGLAGKTLTEAAAFFDEAVVLGVIRRTDDGFEAILAPPFGFVIGERDELVFIARSFEACTPSAADAGLTKVTAHHGYVQPAHRPRRVLVLGWNHKVPAIVRELDLDCVRGGLHEVDVFSSKPATERATAIGDDPHESVRVTQLEGDYAAPGELARLELARYDNIVFMASDRVDSPYESDARTILGHLLLEDALRGVAKRPASVVELMSTENVELLGTTASETVVSPVILSHILTQVALRRELHAVYTELFGTGGAELVLRETNEYGIPAEAVSFADVQAAASARHEIAVGVRRGGKIELVPERAGRFVLGPDDHVVAVTRVEEERRTRASSFPPPSG
jgi:ion channel POLLUX/CASTOR